MDLSKRKRILRYILLNKLLNKKINISNNSARPEYMSPADRSSYNYGYMTSAEIGAGEPNIW
jgi:hypothetical protein